MCGVVFTSRAGKNSAHLLRYSMVCLRALSSLAQTLNSDIKRAALIKTEESVKLLF